LCNIVNVGAGLEVVILTYFRLQCSQLFHWARAGLFCMVHYLRFSTCVGLRWGKECTKGVGKRKDACPQKAAWGGLFTIIAKPYFNALLF